MMDAMRRAWLGMLALAGAAWSADLADTARTYQRMCAQCHGVDGDGLFYENIVPLAGIARRYPEETIGRLSGAFSGRTLQGEELALMVAYMGTLRGEKGFAEPGWIASPYFVEKKAPRVGEVRILDMRPRAVFEAAHVPNAVSVEPGACIEPAERTHEWLRARGVGRDALVIVADQEGGPDAACLWWRLRRAGHEWVAVMDGGMRRYRNERRPMEGSGFYEPPPLRSRETLDNRGFLPHQELGRVIAEQGFAAGTSRRWSGSQPELAHLVLSLSLLGRKVRYDEADGRVIVDAALR
ncbi:MAG: hypothetical protein J0L64_16320 [Acidobacteria bacterium]|nr:hypothetical protein [Acidobacteriota bacterium]